MAVVLGRKGGSAGGGGAPSGPAGGYLTGTYPNPSGPLLFYAQVTSTVTTTATVEASAENLVSLGAQTYAAVPTWLEFYCALVQGTAGGATIATLWDGAAELCRLGDFRGTSSSDGHAMLCRIKITPSAGSHTYIVKGFGINSIAWNCGTGSGGAATYAPMYLSASVA